MTFLTFYATFIKENYFMEGKKTMQKHWEKSTQKLLEISHRVHKNVQYDI